MRTIRWQGTHCCLLDVIFVAFAALALVACVQSEQPLLSSSEQLFGDEFQLNLYEAVTNDLAAPPKISLFRWNAGRYDIVKGGVSKETSIVVKSVGANEFIVQLFDGKRYGYSLARRLAGATYQVRAVDDPPDVAMLEKLCVKKHQLDCTIETRAQLDAFTRASLAKPMGAFWILAVLSHPE